MLSNILDGFSDLGGAISNVFQELQDGFSSMLSSIGNGFSYIGELFADLFSSLGDIFSSLSRILDFINPFHEDFLLKLALVPSDGYMEQKTETLRNVLAERFHFINQIQDALDSVFTRIDSGQWEGIKANVPLINKELVIISPVFINATAGKIKAFVGGIIVLYLFLFLIRRGSKLPAEGK